MPWVSITLEVEPAAGDALSDALLDCGAQSVSFHGGSVSALIRPGDDATALVGAACDALGIPARSFSLETVHDQDWVRSTQAQFTPLEVGRRLWVGASWHRSPPGRALVRVDPGLAFGTGSHPTTKLVLGYLEAQIRGGERVLDYGCGSGILAIAAARLGASLVEAVDLDPQAVETANANAQANQVALKATLPHMLTTAQYDVVVSNILSQTLIVLEPLLAARTAPAGRLALSGILESQAAEVCAAYAPHFDVTVAAQEEGWVLVAGTRE
jgi:ribosomal protein L11 methyltransferase